MSIKSDFDRGHAAGYAQAKYDFGVALRSPAQKMPVTFRGASRDKRAARRVQANVGWPRDMFSPHWPPSLKVREQYRVNCDDNSKAWFGVLIAEDGDVHVAMHEPSPHTQEYGDPFPSVRIRTTYGGGRNLRTRQALLWLAEAMRLDNEENDKRYEAPNKQHDRLEDKAHE